MIGDAPPILPYGRRPVSPWRWGLRAAALLGAATLTVFVCSRVAWPRYERWQAARTQAHWIDFHHKRSVAWYPRACVWIEPATMVKWSTAKADVERFRYATGVPAAIGFPSAGEQGTAFRSEDPRSYFIVDEPTLFTHLRSDRSGTSRLVCVGVDDPEGGRLPLIVTLCDALPDGRAVQTAIGRTLLDLTALGDTRELRLFAGKPDPNDRSRFTIPFESHGRSGVIDGVFESAAIVSPTIGNTWPSREVDCGVRLSLRLTSTTQATPSE